MDRFYSQCSWKFIGAIGSYDRLHTMRGEESSQLPRRISERESSQRGIHNWPALELFGCWPHPCPGHGEIHPRLCLPHHARPCGSIRKNDDVFTRMKNCAVKLSRKERRILVTLGPGEQNKVGQITDKRVDHEHSG